MPEASTPEASPTIHVSVPEAGSLVPPVAPAHTHPVTLPTPAVPVPPVPAQGRATSTQDAKPRPRPAPAVPPAAEHGAPSLKGCVKVDYLGPKEPVVVCGNPSMRWQKGISTRESRTFKNPDEGLQFETVTWGEVKLVPEDSPRAANLLFKVTRL